MEPYVYYTAIIIIHQNSVFPQCTKALCVGLWAKVVDEWKILIIDLYVLCVGFSQPNICMTMKNKEKKTKGKKHEIYSMEKNNNRTTKNKMQIIITK